MQGLGDSYLSRSEQNGNVNVEWDLAHIS
jgi:hypothetical protein